MTETLYTDVLVVGSGPAGATAALALSTLGVEHLVITKYSWTANTPRAHITNQRTVEIFRDLGIEDEIRANGTPQRLMGDTVFCTSLRATRSAASAPGAPTPPVRRTTPSPVRQRTAICRRRRSSRS
ncbi:MAG: FAD-dependent monooxygenase [Solirubrobacteraceae bacterium]